MLSVPSSKVLISSRFKFYWIKLNFCSWSNSNNIQRSMVLILFIDYKYSKKNVSRYYFSIASFITTLVDYLNTLTIFSIRTFLVEEICYWAFSNLIYNILLFHDIIFHLWELLNFLFLKNNFKMKWDEFYEWKTTNK